MQKRILLLGSGELGKEFTIAAQRLGQYVIAIDSYPGAPAMQVAHEWHVLPMLDADALDRIVAMTRPDIIVPEIEAIRTERLYAYQERGIQVVPSAKAADFTMNRRSIRDLAAGLDGVRTASFRYAYSQEEFADAVSLVGLPCVVKPLMSSSGKGQSVVRSLDQIPDAWSKSQSGGRGDIAGVIIEEFIAFDYEITLLTVTQKSGPTLFCPPIGHRQERGDYQESWQPIAMSLDALERAQSMAASVCAALGGYGIWGVEFFIRGTDVFFSELSPRPHDTGMVTLGGTQNLSEFELHARAVLGLPIPCIELVRHGASAVVLASDESEETPEITGLGEALHLPYTDVRVFGKPSTRPFRRMAVAVASGALGEVIDTLRQRAVLCASRVRVNGKGAHAGASDT